MGRVGELILLELFLNYFESIHPKRADPYSVYGRLIRCSFAVSHLKPASRNYNHFDTGLCLYDSRDTGGLLGTAAARQKTEDRAQKTEDRGQRVDNLTSDV